MMVTEMMVKRQKMKNRGVRNGELQATVLTKGKRDEDDKTLKQ